MIEPIFHAVDASLKLLASMGPWLAAVFLGGALAWLHVDRLRLMRECRADAHAARAQLAELYDRLLSSTEEHADEAMEHATKLRPVLVVFQQRLERIERSLSRILNRLGYRDEMDPGGGE